MECVSAGIRLSNLTLYFGHLSPDPKSRKRGTLLTLATREEVKTKAAAATEQNIEGIKRPNAIIGMRESSFSVQSKG